MLRQNQSENDKDERLYYGLLRRVGLQGPYQTNLMRILYLIAMISGATFNIVPYLFYQDAYRCQQYKGNCNLMVCSLPIEQRGHYLNDQPLLLSLADFYGDMHCEKTEDLTVLKEFFLVGTSAGVFLILSFIDVIGRKRAISIGLIISVISITVLTIFESFLVKGICLFLWGGCAEVSFSILMTFITQKVDQKNRASCYVQLQFWYIFGILLVIIFFYLLREWRLVLWTYFTPFYVVSIISFVWYVQGTPIDLISRQSALNAFEAFARIANRNHIKEHQLTLEQIQSLQRQYRQNKIKKHDYHFNFMDLLKFPSIRYDFLKLGYMYFIIFFIAFGHSFVIDQLNIKIFLLTLINYTAQLLVLSLMITFTIISISSFVTYGLAPNDCFQCKTGWVFIFILISYFCTRFFTNLSANLFKGSLNETFPAQIRPIALYGTVGIARISTIILPFLSKLKDTFDISLILQFSIAGVFGILGASMVRETFNKLPQEFIEQLKFQNNPKDTIHIH